MKRRVNVNGTASTTGGNGRLARTKQNKNAKPVPNKYAEAALVKLRPALHWRFSLCDGSEPTWRGYIDGEDVALVGRSGWCASNGAVRANDSCYDDW